MHISVSKKWGDRLIEAGFDGPPQGITALFGPSGAGKTSVINMVAGLLKPDKGRISVNGHCLFDAEKGVCLPPEKRRVGYVFQDGRLFPHLSVKANLLYGARGRGGGVDFEDAVALLGIGDLLQRKPRTLSGGEKQRVAFGRAVLASPKLLLMDEPLASLDAARKEELLPFIRLLNRRYGIPVLYVSHSRKEIEALADKVVSVNTP